MLDWLHFCLTSCLLGRINQDFSTRAFTKIVFFPFLVLWYKYFSKLTNLNCNSDYRSLISGKNTIPSFNFGR